MELNGPRVEAAVSKLAGVDRIAITGNSGSGKSTLAVSLGESLRLPVIHHDQLFWHRDGSARALVDFLPELRRVLSTDRWIFEGFHKETQAMVFERAQLVVVLDVPRWICVWRLTLWPSRRPGLPQAPSIRRFSKRHLRFLRWVWIFPTDRRPGLMASAKAHAADRMLVARSTKTVRALLEEAAAA